MVCLVSECCSTETQVDGIHHRPYYNSNMFDYAHWAVSVAGLNTKHLRLVEEDAQQMVFADDVSSDAAVLTLPFAE